MRQTHQASSRLKVLAVAALLTLALPLAAETRSGRTSASATSLVSMRFPSVHGVNVPSLPPRTTSSSAVVFASRSARGSVETLPLQLMSTNGSSAIQMVRTVRRAADRSFALASSRGGDDANQTMDVRSSSRDGALGWTSLNDRIDLPATSVVSSGPSQRTTVVYEIWDF